MNKLLAAHVILFMYIRHKCIDVFKIIGTVYVLGNRLPLLHFICPMLTTNLETYWFLKVPSFLNLEEITKMYEKDMFHP